MRYRNDILVQILSSAIDGETCLSTIWETLSNRSEQAIDKSKMTGIVFVATNNLISALFSTMFLYKHITYSALIAALILCPVSTLSAYGDTLATTLPEGVFGYRETVGDKVIPFNWKAEETDDGVVIKVFEDQKTFHNYCNENGETTKWFIKVEGKHDIVAERHDNVLHISGTRYGEPYEISHEIDDRPWYQPLSYSLGSFLNSDKKDTSFWVIRADTIEVIALTAKKMGDEELLVKGKKVMTQKVEVRAEGFKSKFWYASYWYRKSDNLFVRYQSVHGLPGTDETIVELVKSPNGDLDS